MEIAQEKEKTIQGFSIRKFSVGVCSALIGLAFLGTGAVSADETVSTSEQPLETSSVATEDVNHLVREAGVYTADAALPTADPAKPATEAVTPEASPTSTEASSTTTDTPAVSETEKPKATAEKVADLPTNEEKQLRPKEVKFDTWDDLLKPRIMRLSAGKSLRPMLLITGNI